MGLLWGISRWARAVRTRWATASRAWSCRDDPLLEQRHQAQHGVDCPSPCVQRAPRSMTPRSRQLRGYRLRPAPSVRRPGSPCSTMFERGPGRRRTGRLDTCPQRADLGHHLAPRRCRVVFGQRRIDSGDLAGERSEPLTVKAAPQFAFALQRGDFAAQALRRICVNRRYAREDCVFERARPGHRRYQAR